MQTETTPGATENYLEKARDFSLVCGGPLYRLWRGVRLSGDGMEFTRRRVLAAAMLGWLPLLLLSIVEGHAWGGGVALPFLRDIETHARLLLMGPLLILAEVTVHRVLSAIVRQFIERGLVPEAARAKFDAAIGSAMRLRDSVLAELLMIVFVYTIGVPRIWRDQMTVDVNSWYASPVGGELQATYAGWWLALLPVCPWSSSCACAGPTGSSSGRVSCCRCRSSGSTSNPAILTPLPDCSSCRARAAPTGCSHWRSGRHSPG